MTHQPITETIIQGGQQAAGVPLGAWIRANAVGLAITFALFGLVGEGMEAVGADHDSIGWAVPTLAAMVVGGTVFARLRQRVLGALNGSSWWHTLVIGAGVVAGFVAGLIPPLDFIVGILAAGMIGGALQLRETRRRLGRSRSLLLVGAGAWLVAGLAAVAAAILVADVILVGALGLRDEVDEVGGFAAILAVVGLVGGSVGGAIEGAAIRRRLARSAAS